MKTPRIAVDSIQLFHGGEVGQWANKRYLSSRATGKEENKKSKCVKLLHLRPGFWFSEAR